MWKVFRAIKNFFTAIDNFLTMCEDYLELRVRTGKAKGDIEVVTKKLKEETHEKVTTTSNKVYHSSPVQHSLSTINQRWAALMKIPILENIATLIIDAFFLVKNFYDGLFLSSAALLLSFLVLLNLFEHSALIFFTSFFPILFLNAFCLSVIYYRIDRLEKGEKVSLVQGLQAITRHFPSVMTVIFIHIFVILQLIVLFLVFTVFLTYAFETIKLNWTNSFIYWFFIVTLFFYTTIILFVFGIVANQAYYIALLQQKKPFPAFKAGWKLLDNYAFSFFFYYILLYVLASWVLYWATNTFFHTGFIISLFIFTNAAIFLGFLLRRKFINKLTFTDEQSKTKQPLVAIILFFGFFVYILIAALGIKKYPTVINFIESIQEDLTIKKQLTKTYVDEKFGYSINYPKTWDLYGWNDNSVTFYNNYTGSISGGIWLNIIVFPFSQDTFDKLYESKTGLFSYDIQTKDVTTKISNVSIDGYDAVNYLYTKAATPYPQHQTHYLIHRNQRTYDIVFITMSKDVEQRNSDTFKEIINSFKFIR